MAKAASPRAMERAIEMLESSDPTVALKAITIVLERAYGKPAQPVDGDGEGGAIKQFVEVRFVKAGQS